MTPYLKQNKFGEGLLNGTVAVSQIIAKDARVNLTGQAPIKVTKKRRSGLSILPIIIFIIIFMGLSRRRSGSWWLFLPLLMGGGRGYGSGGGGFGGFSGGFGGFGGGMSGGGGAGGSF
jgi:uncharacterized protein